MNDSSYIESIYQQWKRDPSGVDPSWSTYFEQLADTGAANSVR
jgi:2-oxoglutarate dehydrogenase complex dehydrogenase (E1) component-like enzyme